MARTRYEISIAARFLFQDVKVSCDGVSIENITSKIR